MGQGSRTINFGNIGRKALVAALLATTAVGGGIAASTIAQAQAAYSVPAGPLNRALATFGSQSGTQISYEASIVRGKSSQGVSGAATREQAIAQLLQGTGLRYSFTDATSVVVSAPTAGIGDVAADGSTVLETITVQGSSPNSVLGDIPPAYAGGQVATGGQVGMLGNRDVMNTPFSQTSYTNKTLQDQQARSLKDVLANDASVVSATRDADTDIIRGFQDQGYQGTRSLNGLGGMAPLQAPSLDYIEQVQVLRGPSALLNGTSASGSGGLGGTTNLVTKRAGDEPLTELTTRYESRSQFGTHLDVGRRFGTNKEFGVRFNGSIDDGHTPIDSQDAQLGVAALNVDYRGDRVRWSADFVHQTQEGSPGANTLYFPRAFLASLTKVPDAPDNTTAFRPEWDYTEYKTTLGMFQTEVDLTDSLTTYAAFGAQRYEYNGRNALATLTDATGSYTYQPQWRRQIYDVLSFEGGLRGTADTGPISHSYNIEASHARHTNSWVTAATGSVLSFGSIYNPVFSSTPSFVDPGDPLKASETHVSSIGFADTLSVLDERMQFTLGLRYQNISSDNFDRSTGAVTSSYDEFAWTPAFGVVVKPWNNVSLYANYIENLQAGTSVGSSYANAGEVFSPYVSKQYEAGVKVDWGRVTTTMAVFQIAQPSTIDLADPSGGLPTLAVDGEQRNRGVELNAYGEVFDGIRLLGGVTFLDARQIKTASGLYDGARARGAPKFRAVIGGEWDSPFVEGLTLTGRFTYTSNQTIHNSMPDLTIPSWTQLDLGARYTFNTPWNENPITVRFNVDNVFNDSFWKGSYSGSMLYLSEPRTYRLSTTFKF